MAGRGRFITLLTLLLGLIVVPLAQGGFPEYLGPIYNGPELDYQPSIIRVQPSGDLLVVFERLQVGTYMGDFYVTRSTDDGETWFSPTPALTSARNERHPSLLQLGPNGFALFYLLCDDHSGANARIHRATSPDGLTWTDQGAVDLGWVTTGELNPDVIREADGSLTMTYQRGASYIARSTDDGVTWDALRTQVSNGNAQLPRLAKRESDGLYIVSYQVGSSNLDLYAKVSTDPYDWSGPQIPISTDFNTHDSKPMVLEDSTFIVFYASTPVYYFDVFYRISCNGIDWADPVQVTDNPQRYDTQPHSLLQGTPGHVILTWPHQDDGNPTPYVDHDVWVNSDLEIALPTLDASKEVNPLLVAESGPLTYTIHLRSGRCSADAASLRDPIPPDTVYDGWVWASSGDYGYDAANDLITWTGSISPNVPVTITFRVSTTLTVPDGRLLSNVAVLTDGLGVTYTLTATATADALPPTSTIQDPQDGQLISTTTYLVSGVASDSVSGVDLIEVSADGGPWEPATGTAAWSYTWSSLSDGEHNIRSRATDGVGHVETPGPGITFTVDATPPVLEDHDPADGALNVPLSATVVLTFSEALLTDTLAYTITPNPGGWTTTWSGDAAVAYLAHADFVLSQTYTFTVLQAYDPAYNPLGPVMWSFSTPGVPCRPVEILTVTTDISGCLVTFGAELSGDPPYTYTWAFGAFGTYTEPNPVIDFAATGTYTGTVHVYNCTTGYDTTDFSVYVDCTPQYTIYLPVVLRAAGR